MPIPQSVVNLVRNSSNQVVYPVFNYWPAEEVASGSITATPLRYPVGEVNVVWSGGDFQNIEVGQLWIITTGAGNKDIVSYGVVRKPSNSNTLFIDGKSRGDSGIAREKVFGITAGHRITVYSMKPLWSLLSRIVDGAFFKQFDIPYNGEGGNPAPVVNMGTWRQAFVSPGTNRAEFFFSANNSFAWGDKSITSFFWELPPEAIVTSATVNNSSLAFTLPQGFYKIKCTITDSGGVSHTGTRPVWVNGNEFPPLSEQYAFEINGDSQDRKGRNQSLTFVGEMDRSDFLPGMALHYSEVALYDNQEITPSSLLINNFAGFAAEESRVYDLVNGEKATSFEFFGPWAWMELIPMVSQAIVEVDSPAAWTDVAPGLGIPQFIIWYVLKHHSTFLDLFDYEPFFEFDAVTSKPDDRRKLNWGLNGSTLAEYVDQIAGTIGGNAGCKSDGTMAFRRDPIIEYTAIRDETDVRITLTIDENAGIIDFAESLEIPKTFHNQVGQLRVFTLSYDGAETTAFGSIAPGYTQMQAPGTTDEDSFIIRPPNGRDEGQFGFRPGGQDETNRLSGHLLARKNSPTPEISGVLVRNMDFFDPAEMAWVSIDIPDTWSPRNVPIETRTLPLTVERSWEESEGGGFVKIITLSVQPETFGQPGETYNIDTGGGDFYFPIIPPVAPIIEPFPDLPGFDDIVDQAGAIFAINDAGDLGRQRDGLNWNNIRGNIVNPNGGQSKFQDMAFDMFSPFPQSGFVTGPLGVWTAVAEESGIDTGAFNTVKIYYTFDILEQNVIWSEQATFTASNNVDGSIRLRSSVEDFGYAACAIGTVTGMFFLRTVNGSSWSLLGSGNTGVSNNFLEGEVDFCFSGTRIIGSGYDSNTNKWLLTRTSSQTGSFSFVPNSPESDLPWPLIEKHLDDGTVYATQVISETYTGTSSISQSIAEEDPQTQFNVPGSNEPVLVENTSGTLPSSSWNPEVRGDPLNGFESGDDEPDQVAGYHDSDRNNPTTSICGPGTLNEYNSDDGWLFNDTYLGTPDIKSEPNDEIKFGVTVGIPGKWDFNSAGMSGVFTYEGDVGGKCNTAAMIIGVQNLTLELFGEFGASVNLYGGPGDIDGDGWFFSASQTSASPVNVVEDTSPLGYTNVSGGTLKYTSPKGTGAGGATIYMRPTCESWGFAVENVTTFEPTLYAIDFITSANPSYNDITPIGFGRPNDTFVPVTPYSFAIDAVDPLRIRAILERTTLGGRFRGSSSNGGGSFGINTGRQTNIRGTRLSGGFGLAWGFNTMEITSDDFLTTFDLIGNWSAVFASGPGLVRVMKAVLIPEF